MNKTFDIVKYAMTKPISDIGQFTKENLKVLNLAVKQGTLDKGKGGPFPAIKTVYAIKGFDFAADRQNHINVAMLIKSIEAL